MGKLAMKESGEEVWGARQRLFDDNDALVLKISVLPGEICALSAELHQWTGNDGADVEVVAQATGLMTVGLKSAHRIGNRADGKTARARTCFGRQRGCAAGPG